MYSVVRCPKCKSLMLAKMANKTRTCPKCGYRAILSHLRVLGKADSPRKAVNLIQTLKYVSEEEKKRSKDLFSRVKPKQD